MKEVEYFKLRQEIESRYKSDLASLDRIWALANKTNPPKAVVAEASKGGISKTVKAVVAAFPGPFTVADVIAATIKADPATSKKVPAIRTAFKRLEVEVVAPKAGGRQALYRLKKEAREPIAPGSDGEEVEEVPF